MRLFQPIDRYIPAVDPMGARRRQKRDDVGDLVDGAEPAHRKTVANVILEIFRVGEPVAVPAIVGGQDRPRRHGIHPNAARHKFQ